MTLIVGLGNPSSEGYARHRHNVGARCLHFLAREHRIPLGQRLARCRIGRGSIAGAEVVLARPLTFMNLSGEAVAALLGRLQLPPSDLVVIHDDLDLLLGQVRLRPGGSAGGHRGVESIVQRLGPNFSRVRVGIGRPPEDLSPDKEEAIVAHVLSPFTPQEQALLEGVYPRVAQAIACLLQEGIQAAMNRYN